MSNYNISCIDEGVEKFESSESVIELTDNKKSIKNPKPPPKRVASSLGVKKVKFYDEKKLMRFEKELQSVEKPTHKLSCSNLHLLPHNFQGVENVENTPQNKESKKSLPEVKTNDPKVVWKKRIITFLDSYPVLIFMSLVTLITLFSTDLQLAYMGKGVDLGFNIVQILILIIYGVEFVLNCLVKDDYLYSFFFWLDLASTISLLQDIDYFMNFVMGYEPAEENKFIRNRNLNYRAAKAVAQVSAASRATRILRVIRIIRLLRMIKIYKGVYKTRENIERRKEIEKRKLLEKLDKDLSEVSSSGTPHHGSILSNALGLEGGSNTNVYNSENIAKLVKKIRFKKRFSVLGGGDSNGPVTNSTGSNPGAAGGNQRFSLLVVNHADPNRLTGLQENASPKRGTVINSMLHNPLKASLNRFALTREKTIRKEDIKPNLSEEGIINESKISKIITQSLTKKVIILIMIVLLIFPLLSEDFYKTDSKITYQLLCDYIENYLEVLREDNFKITLKSDDRFGVMVDKNFPVINITRNHEILYRNPSYSNNYFRYKEVKTIYSSNANIMLVYSTKKDSQLSSKLNIVQTIFICFCLGVACISFEDDANYYVLEPLEEMIEIVERVSRDPIGAKNIEEFQTGVKAVFHKIHKEIKEGKEIEDVLCRPRKTSSNKIQASLHESHENHESHEESHGKKNEKKEHKDKIAQNYEILIIKEAIIKISALLAIGFGEAGGEIIRKNITSNEFNPKLKGKKKKAIFGFCDIRGFSQINLALEEDIMIFVNKIAEIVHSSVDIFKGATNKNMGDSFLTVWKFYNEVDSQGKKKTYHKKDNLMDVDPTNPQVAITADCSVLGFLRVLLKINKNIDILAYRHNEEILKRIPDFRLEMGVGLHMGYGIEGAIGSLYKIEASYLSSNVNIAARLETATRQFGVYILISGTLYKLLSEEMKSRCRFIDIVKVKGSQRPIRLYTIDININVTPQKRQKFLELTDKEKREIYLEKKNKIQAMIEEFGGNITQLILEKNSYKELVKIKDQEFMENWEKGMECYIKGDWKSADTLFNKCLAIDPDDGPAKTLLKFINATNCIAPKSWEGVRELKSK